MIKDREECHELSRSGVSGLVRFRLLTAALVLGLFVGACSGSDGSASETTVDRQTSVAENSETTEPTPTTEQETTTTTLREWHALQASEPGTPEAQVETTFWMADRRIEYAWRNPTLPEQTDLERFVGGELLRALRNTTGDLETEGAYLDNRGALTLIYEVIIDGDTATVTLCHAGSAEYISVETGETLATSAGITRSTQTAELTESGWVMVQSKIIDGIGEPNFETGEIGCLNDFFTESVTEEDIYVEEPGDEASGEETTTSTS